MALLFVGVLAGCGIASGPHRQRLEVGDPRVSVLWNAAGVDREANGLMSLPASGTVVLTEYTGDPRGAGYDALLNYGTETATVEMAFTREDGRLRWLGEDDTYIGLRDHDTADGVEREHIVVSYWPSGAQYRKTGLDIRYEGDDESLWAAPLTMSEMRAKLREWTER